MGNVQEISWRRLAALVGAIAASVASGYYLQPKVSANKDAVNAVITIFSILAGFLVAVLTLIVDPMIAKARNWKDLQAAKAEVRRKLIKHQILFVLYLLSLGLAFSIFVISPEYALAKKVVEMIFVGLSTFVFLMSFSLPRSLMRLQMDKYEAEIRRTAPPAIRSNLPGDKKAAS